MNIQTQEEALHYVDTEIRKTAEGPDELGEATINETVDVNGHKAWAYYIVGTYVALNGMKHWLIDTGETVSTSHEEGQETIPEAYRKLYGRELS